MRDVTLRALVRKITCVQQADAGVHGNESGCGGSKEQTNRSIDVA